MFTPHTAPRVPTPFLLPPGSQAMWLWVLTGAPPPPPHGQPSSRGLAASTTAFKPHFPDPPPLHGMLRLEVGGETVS